MEAALEVPISAPFIVNVSPAKYPLPAVVTVIDVIPPLL
jgi:hypothetical protein